MTFGETLRRAREQLNLSQEAAAKAIEAKYQVRLSAAYLSMIENGVKTNLTIKRINALLAFFQLPFHAAASLFPLSGPLSQEPVPTVRETPERYLPEDTELPPEARQALTEFQDFLEYKYLRKQEPARTKR